MKLPRLAAVLAALLAACASGEVTDAADASAEDAGGDARSDAAQDTGVDDARADAEGDVVPDADHPDIGVDTRPDADRPDVGIDTENVDADDGGADVADAADADVDEGSDTQVGDVSTDVADVAIDVAADAAPDELGELLDALAVDLEGTLVRVSHTTGWPAPVSDGVLVVTTDTTYPMVAGDFDGWTGTPLQSASGFRWAVIPADPGGYKLTDGADRWDADPWARAWTVDEFGELSLVSPEGEHFARVHAVGDDRIPARMLRLLVPAEPVTHVLYAHDGQNLFLDGGAFGSWSLEDSAPPGMLIVGIDNSPDRIPEYTHTPDLGFDARGADYARYVVETVRPLVRDAWGEPGRVGVMGSSLGGLISLYIGLQYPDDWDFVASLSGSLYWGSAEVDTSTMMDLYRAAGRLPFAVYVDSGGGGTCVDTDGDGVNDDGDDQDGYCVTLQMRDVLDELGWTFDVDLWHWWEPGAPHNEAAWAARVFRPLQAFAGL